MEKEKGKRKFLRLKAYHLVKYKLITGIPTSKFLPASLRDICVGGAYMRTDIKLPVSGTVELMISFPGFENPLKITSKIVWEKPKKIGPNNFFDYGLEFLGLDDSLRNDMLERINKALGILAEKNK